MAFIIFKLFYVRFYGKDLASKSGKSRLFNPKKWYLPYFTIYLDI